MNTLTRDILLKMPSVTPDQIITYGKMIPRPIQLDVSVVSYFQQFFQRTKKSSNSSNSPRGARVAPIKSD